MICRQCQRDNPPQNAFCHACGAPMGGAGQVGSSAAVGDVMAAAAATTARCPRCGTENGRNTQFCRTCGSDLTGVSGGRPPAGVSAPAGPAVPPSLAPMRAPHGASAPAAGAGQSCRRCGGLSDPLARFCKFCGSPFDGVPAPSAAQAPQVAQRGPAQAPVPSQSPLAELGPTQQLHAQVVVIHRDGSEGGVYALEAGQSDIGSREGDIVLPDDPYLSPRHARIERRGDTFVLRDLDSSNGVYIRLRDPVELTRGDMFLIGQQVLRFEVLPETERRVGPAKQHGVMVFGTPELPRLARIAQYTTEGLERDVHYLYRDETVFGREQADVVFAEDPFLSRRHAAITMDRENMRFALRDLGSSNGTAIRCRTERALQHGDQFRLGRHLFRFDLTITGRGGRNP
jgi:pSer/pThr/pTyr-binding forkhead associated (FHA) protein